MRPSRQHEDSIRGFTLIEILIVLALIAILTSIVVPTLISRRVTANESAAVASLRTIAQAQYQFKSMQLLDTNNDSGAEFGTLGELAGIDVLRGDSSPLINRLLPTRLGKVDSDGYSSTHGYYFCVYLPQTSGEGVVAVPSNLGQVDPMMARDYWSVVAWPVIKGTTGKHAFFTNQNGEILRTRNAVYDGKGNVPAPGCALVGVAKTHLNAMTIAANATGADGLLWVVVN